MHKMWCKKLLSYMYNNTQAGAGSENAVFCSLPTRTYGNGRS